MTAAPSALSVAVRTVRIDDPGPLLDLLPDRDGLAWVRRGEGMVGWGEVASWRGVGADRFAAAQQWWRTLTQHSVVRDQVHLAGSGLIAFGSFAFSDGPGSESVMVVPEVIVGRRSGVWWLTTIAADGRLPAPSTRQAQLHPPAPAETPTLHWLPDEDGPADWTRIVEQAVARIQQGALDKVVLARQVTARAQAPIDPREALRRLGEQFPSCWTFGVDGLFGATPELLVRLTGSLATSRVLAGTIRRTDSEERDAALAATLARSSKDLEEHEYAVQSVADSLAPHCTGMNVPEAPYVLHLPNVMHLASDVTGVVRDGSSVLDLVADLHPSAAVGGTPTAAAVALIEASESAGRGRFAGPVGWLDAAGDGEWGIALRCAQLDDADPSIVRLHAGCGIVADSDADDEWAESEAKLAAMRYALGQG